MKLSSILGLNARTQLFSYLYNLSWGKGVANSKIKTAKVLIKADIPHPQIYKKFLNSPDINDFDWNLPGKFVLKPSRGMGGEGIIVVKKKAEDGKGWITSQKEKVSIDDLKLHILDILEGAYSLGNVPDVAFIQEYVGRHKAFRKYAFRGTPDIRIIVFNRVPVMAMLRLPTRESKGRANLHQGAIGVGIDIATGITTKAILNRKYIHTKPGTDRKLHGIKIPQWENILETAVKAQIVSGLGYVGVDLVLHPEKGPMILELNGEPGLTIQLANGTGLKKRLERVEDLEVKDAQQGVKIAKLLFAGPFVDRVRAEEGIKTVNIFETVKVRAEGGKKVLVEAKLDTGAWRTSIDGALAKELGLLEEGNILWYKKVKSALGVQERPVIDLIFWLSGRKIETSANIADRSGLKKKIVVGRKALKGFLVSPELKIE
jgi:alpha-L-glutamate ligase-like protein